MPPRFWASRSARREFTTSGVRRNCADSSGLTQSMENDDELRARFRALANEDSLGAPPLSRSVLEAKRFGRRRRSAWYAPGRVAAVAVSVVGVIAALALG